MTQSGFEPRSCYYPSKYSTQLQRWTILGAFWSLLSRPEAPSADVTGPYSFFVQCYDSLLYWASYNQQQTI